MALGVYLDYSECPKLEIPKGVKGRVSRKNRTILDFCPICDFAGNFDFPILQLSTFLTKVYFQATSHLTFYILSFVFCKFKKNNYDIK